MLISLMLSSQTKDMVTGGAMTNLKKHGLTIENILKTPEEDIARMIHPVGFWKVRERERELGGGGGIPCENWCDIH